MEKKHEDWVSVVATCEPLLIALAKSILDAVGIPYFVRGEAAQYVFVYAMGGQPVELLVSPTDEAAARDALAELESSASTGLE